MIEVEVKACVENVKRFKDLLGRFGAKFSHAEEHVDVYYNNPDLRDFRVSDEALRLRRVNNLVLLTYKGKKIDSISKSRLEIECAISSFEEMDAILKSLGFLPVGEVVKHRHIYLIEELTICVDEVRNLGSFVEVELASSDESGVENGVRRAIGLLEQLGLSKDDLIRRSYLEMMLGGRS
ncbi:class IV adenylate cyclase [Methanosarcinales archaeon ex4572_44]|nr:MAG: class IV adenylate cyclase [Methanosarcinales archaeon ex4572_44]RLG25666.1 MAG: class IV adenylate cyclase [Methanosarcinales archaeon]